MSGRVLVLLVAAAALWTSSAAAFPSQALWPQDVGRAEPPPAPLEVLRPVFLFLALVLGLLLVAWGWVGPLGRFAEPRHVAERRREAILEAVRREPGIGLRHISESVMVPLPTVRRHVRLLKAEAKLVERRDGGRAGFFEGHPMRQEETARPYVRHQLDRRAR